MQEPIDDQNSPFHEGEQRLQRLVGHREKTERIGRKLIRDYLPEQHRLFFKQLPFLIGACVDADGWPWASVISGTEGFVKSPTEKLLVIDRCLLHAAQDPVAIALLKEGESLGLLGIDLTARRRNRVNVQVLANTDNIELAVEQSFGNCPQYIQTREFESSQLVSASTKTHRFTQLDVAASTMIKMSDTFFVASAYPQYAKMSLSDGGVPNAYGVDVSHRGGLPGFVNVDGDTLTIPDFSGNNFYNTLGNFAVNPKAGLVFIDFQTGELLLLTGTVTLLNSDHPEIKGYENAKSAWRFDLVNGIRIENGFPFRATLKDYSPKSIRAGTWADIDMK